MNWPAPFTGDVRSSPAVNRGPLNPALTMMKPLSPWGIKRRTGLMQGLLMKVGLAIYLAVAVCGIAADALAQIAG